MPSEEQLEDGSFLPLHVAQRAEACIEVMQKVAFPIIDHAHLYSSLTGNCKTDEPLTDVINASLECGNRKFIPRTTNGKRRKQRDEDSGRRKSATHHSTPGADENCCGNPSCPHCGVCSAHRSDVLPKVGNAEESGKFNTGRIEDRETENVGSSVWI